MKINEQFMEYGVERAAQMQIRDQYKSLGYSVSLEKKIGTYTCDVYVENEKEKIAFELKATRITESTKHKYLEIAQTLSASGIKFNLIVARFPKKKEIVFNELKDLLEADLINNIPNEIDALSTRSLIDEVSDVEIQSIEICSDKISVSGTATISVALQYGSDSDVKNDLGMVDAEECELEFDIDISDMEITSKRKFIINIERWHE